MKQILGIHSAPQPHWVGDGFLISPMFDYNGLGKQQLSPFVLLDYAAPARFEASTHRRGVGPHPHRGFETVTLVYQGELEHRDSSGAGGVISTGDVQWMTAAGGIVHEEFHSHAFTERGGMIEMAQIWVNLPARDKMRQPRYQTLRNAQIPVIELPENQGSVRIIAGELDGQRGPALTFTPMDVRDMRLNRGAKVNFKAQPGHTLALIVLKGDVEVNQQTAIAGQLVHLERNGSEVELIARSPASVLWLSGEPINEPVVGYGPFVMNTDAEIRQAIIDFNQGRFGRITQTVRTVSRLKTRTEELALEEEV